MKKITEQVRLFLENQGFVILSSIDAQGFPHTSCKGIVKVDLGGKIYLLDVFHGLTLQNIKRNPQISVSAVDEHKFIGYCLKGRAKIMPDDKLTAEIISSWEDKITSRLTKRLLKNLREEGGRAQHHEAALPLPKYLICFEAEEIIDLQPKNKGTVSIF